MATSKLSGWKEIEWNRASRRGFSWEEFDRECQRVADNPDRREEFRRRFLGVDPKDEWTPDPDVEGDIPDHLLGYGAPGCFLDENMSAEGCRWPD